MLINSKPLLMHPLRRADVHISFICTSGHKSSQCHCELYFSEHQCTYLLPCHLKRAFLCPNHIQPTCQYNTKTDNISSERANMPPPLLQLARQPFLSHLLDRRLGNSSNVESPFMVFTLLKSILLQNFQRFVQISFTVSTQLLSTTKRPSILFGGDCHTKFILIDTLNIAILILSGN